MAEYRTVEGTFTTIDTLAELTTFLDETSTGPIKVPENASRVAELHVAALAELAAGEGQSYALRLSGKGMRDGEQDVALGVAQAQGGTATGDTATLQARIIKVDMGVKPNENIKVEVGAAGTAISLTGEAIVTLVFT